MNDVASQTDVIRRQQISLVRSSAVKHVWMEDRQSSSASRVSLVRTIVKACLDKEQTDSLHGYNSDMLSSVLPRGSRNHSFIFRSESHCPKLCDLLRQRTPVFSQKGHLACLKCLHVNGCPWDFHACSSAASNGHLDCLKCAHKNGCRWDWQTCTNAAENGNLEVLKWAFQNGCPIRNGCTMTCTMAAMCGHLECLKCARAHGCDWDCSTYLGARLEGHHAIAEWARSNGCPIE